jgi:acyl-coenzyme A synthetase/AMP-(fatty) acid ligase
MTSHPFVQALSSHGDRPALISGGVTLTFSQLLQRANTWQRRFDQAAVPSGSVVALLGDFSIDAVAALLMMIDRGDIIVPLLGDVSDKLREQFRIAQAQFVVDLRNSSPSDDASQPLTLSRVVTEPLLLKVRDTGGGGLVLFSSGSSGKPKAAVHDVTRFLEKFSGTSKPYRTLAFLRLDHIGGINTLLHTLACGGCVVTIDSRDPDTVCSTLSQHSVELLPTTPSFLNMMLLSEAHLRHDLRSLRVIAYATEVMPQSTLDRLREALPWVRLHQNYGMTELGILRTSSENNSTTAVRLLETPGVETRVVDGVLHVRARGAMLGYLNAESPFDSEGWLNTGDAVECDGAQIKILGRRSEIINVGGLKVYPAVVESVLLAMPNVASVQVTGEAHAMLGQIVTADVSLTEPEEPTAFRARLRSHCGSRLQPHEVPAKIRFVQLPALSERFKRVPLREAQRATDEPTAERQP